MCELTTWHTGRTMERTNVRMLIFVFFPDRAKIQSAVKTATQGCQKDVELVCDTFNVLAVAVVVITDRTMYIHCTTAQL